MRHSMTVFGLLAAGVLTCTAARSAHAQQPPAGAEPSQRRTGAEASQRPAAPAEQPPRGQYISPQDVESGRVDLDAAWRGYRRRSPSRTDTYGFRNPGGVGRMLEYYPPDNEFQNPGTPVQAAQFDQGPAATQRSMQLQSQAVGIQRYNAIQSHIDRYGAPMMGWGWGFGFGGVR